MTLSSRIQSDVRVWRTAQCEHFPCTWRWTPSSHLDWAVCSIHLTPSLSSLTTLFPFITPVLWWQSTSQVNAKLSLLCSVLMSSGCRGYKWCWCSEAAGLNVAAGVQTSSFMAAAAAVEAVLETLQPEPQRSWTVSYGQNLIYIFYSKKLNKIFTKMHDHFIVKLLHD